jgi:hypothetical protein
MVAIIVLSIICIGQFAIIFALLNRLLRQANVQTMTIPMPKTAEPPKEIKRPVFSVPLT